MVTTKPDCEFLVRVRTKPDLDSRVICGLTGKMCFCEDTSRFQCTRRTFALDYQAKHPVLLEAGGKLDHITD